MNAMQCKNCVFRTQNSDCCPDYFPHCLGLTRPEVEEKDQVRPGGHSHPHPRNFLLQVYYQERGQISTLSRPPSDCPAGILNISSKI